MKALAKAAVVVVLVSAGGAFGQSAPETRWTEEARQHLAMCGSRQAFTDAECAGAQQQFVREYVAAMRGGYTAQRNVGFMLLPSARVPADDPRNAINASGIHACAWRLVVVEYGHPQVTTGDTGNLDLACGRITPSEQAAARGRAARILNDMAEARKAR